jgi:hypothetical protein
MRNYRAGEIIGGRMVGTKRPVAGLEGLDFYEVWDGNKWTSEENYELDQSHKNKDFWEIQEEVECVGCDSPFCSCRDLTETARNIKEIKELLNMQDEITKEIRNRLNTIGGDK